jgi:hypothetical protein
MVKKRPSVRVVSMKPQPVKATRACRDYHVKLVLAGRLQEVVQFVSDMTGGPMVTGIDGFSIRGIQGAGAVECSLTLQMIRMTAGVRGQAEPSSRNPGEEAE